MSDGYSKELIDSVEDAKKELGIDSLLRELAIIKNIDPKHAIAHINPKIVDHTLSIRQK